MRDGTRLRRAVGVAGVAAAGFLAVWLATGAGADDAPYRLPPARGEIVPFEHGGPGKLMIDEAGVLVVRTDDEWQSLLGLYATGHRVPAASPPADFTRETLLVVSYGRADGCDDPATYVQRVEQVGDTLQATLAWSRFPRLPRHARGADCPGFGPPAAHVVRVPRVSLPVRFVGWAPGFPVPPRATWLDSAAAGRIDTLTTRLRTVPPATKRESPASEAPTEIRGTATPGGETPHR